MTAVAMEVVLRGRWARAWGGRVRHFFTSKTETLCGKEGLRIERVTRWYPLSGKRRCKKCEEEYKKLKEQMEE